MERISYALKPITREKTLRIKTKKRTNRVNQVKNTNSANSSFIVNSYGKSKTNVSDVQEPLMIASIKSLIYNLNKGMLSEASYIKDEKYL